MAKRKRKTKKQTTKKQKQLSEQLQYELLGLLFVFIAIFSSGAAIISDGIIPLTLENIFRFFFGIWYFIASLVLLILGIYLIIKRQFPLLLTKRMVGLIFILLGMLLFTHIQTFEKLLIDSNQASIIKQSWSHFKLFTEDNQLSHLLGGGMVGALLFALSNYLFSFVGTKIVAVFTMLIGFIFLFNMLIGNLFATVKQSIKTAWANQKEKLNERKENQPIKQEKTRVKKRREKRIKEIKDRDNITVIEETEAPMEDIVPFAVEYAIDDKNGQLSMPLSTEDSSKDNNDEELPDDDVEVMVLAESDNEQYILPPFSLLDEAIIKKQTKNRLNIERTVKLLEQTFESFGVKAKITKAHIGPAVTKYEVYPEAGVKVSRIVSLQDDLALALAAQDIRIEAPIPGKSAVGIEVPNDEIATVALSEVLDVKYQQNKKLLFALGKDISGDVIYGELNKMPHLLIAGSTGSGKSVCINGIITSILMRAKPNEVKMMMIDPKKVELNVYNGIPHLLTPVVTDPKKASMALRKIVAEMEDRYERFSETGTRNLEGYNNYIAKQNELMDETTPLLPYIVVLVDELADLMMVASKDVEDSIMRLAQMARAAGIHLIIATQRPSVDVITGVIKANIPSRIAFAVSSQTDSRTILDTGGAEKLLGRGDMLYIPVGMSKPIRVQGAFLSDEEVERIVKHCINEQKAQYQEEMIPEDIPESDDADDELYPEAVQFIIQSESASVSMLQRRFRIGYNRAARLIDLMEERGIVGPYEGNKPRFVLVSKENTDESLKEDKETHIT